MAKAVSGKRIRRVTSGSKAKGAAEVEQRLRVALASDVPGDRLKERLKVALLERRFAVKDPGPQDSAAADLADVATLVGRSVIGAEADVGIIVAASGVGACMAANKLPGIRAAFCTEPLTARQSRSENGANVLCIGQRVSGSDLAVDIALTWLEATIGTDERTARRLERLEELERQLVRPGLSTASTERDGGGESG